MGANAALILLWGANLASQPNTGRHLAAARQRGAHVVTIDVRDTEAAAQSDEVLKLRPGTDTALALAMMHVIIGEGRCDQDFVARHTVGFDALAQHVRLRAGMGECGDGPAAERDRDAVAAIRRDTPAMIVLGGSSCTRANGWRAGRAVACLPALTGISASGGAWDHAMAARVTVGLTDIVAGSGGHRAATSRTRCSHHEAIVAGDVRALLLFGTDMLSSFADAGRLTGSRAWTWSCRVSS
jgi:anaerobic selenocysteine-containing dehydrogenase